MESEAFGAGYASMPTVANRALIVMTPPFQIPATAFDQVAVTLDLYFPCNTADASVVVKVKKAYCGR